MSSAAVVLVYASQSSSLFSLDTPASCVHAVELRKSVLEIRLLVFNKQVN